MAGLGDCSLVLRALEPAGVGGEHSARAPIYPASMIKVPLVAAALSEVAEGRFSLEDRFRVSEANLTLNDAPSPLVTGYNSQLSEILTLTITISDNVGTNMLFDIVGRARATQIVREKFGLAHTAFHRKLSGSEPLIYDAQWDGKFRNAHPAADAAHLFELIARDQVPHAQFLHEVLAAQRFNEKLPPGLVDGDRFEHKTGDTDEASHDGGILTTAEGKRYVIVVYTAQEGTEKHNARMSDFMRALRELL
jgi:beta-lactamase class A